LDHAKELYKQIPKEASLGLLSHIIADDYLNQLQKTQFNVFNPILLQKSPKFWWKLLKASLTKSY
jgi:hypothetical protein